jgi:hypothetical protein
MKKYYSAIEKNDTIQLSENRGVKLVSTGSSNPFVLTSLVQEVILHDLKRKM